MASESFKNKSDAELRTILREKKNFLRDFRFRITKGKMKNVKKGRVLRAEIARVLTEINRRKNG
ncbi:MAG: 50S ribosomal protein L29 [Candidatus Tagabacteria bacterium CG09_land_8_20_14_0_10_41_14]|uniref:Large ribosomal subunit protein uL29 n=2 Tax=Candidatus Tagaibacteriota TaxID=1817918 RepID=A0A2H0WLD9_9BACT|nr:MAG: 50S ribosomal protein L29 [Candidatus Tagabacteria bacterium CG09_land_8_20_14_0_10_41_14]PJE73136.1 MAG: 50S ribosomal protein L29 [Candidatus Tagabacteria bacterium CG10_big_fil_rev_8_21_14_0_10_40_13]